MRKGLVYEITVSVEEQANGLTLTPESTYLSFNPESVSFSGYGSNNITLSVTVPMTTPDGTYTINWQKVEAGTKISYLEAEDSVIRVTQDLAGLPKPKFEVEDFKFLFATANGDIERELVINVTQAPSSDVTLNINLAKHDTLITIKVDNVL